MRRGRGRILDSQANSERAWAREHSRAHKPSEAENKRPRKSFGWTKISAHPSPSSQGGVQARTAIDITGSGSLLRLSPRSGSSRSDRHVGPSQPGLAPAIRSRHSDDVFTGDTMGRSPSRVDDQTRQDRERRQCSSDSRGGPLDHADSAPMDLHRMECGAKESFASQPGQPATRGGQKSGESTSQVHSQGRRRASIPESEATQAGHTSRGSGDAPDPHHPPTGSGDLQRPGHSGEQLCREADRPTPTTRTSQQERAGQRVVKTTALSDERTPTRSQPSTVHPERDMRSVSAAQTCAASERCHTTRHLHFFCGKDRCR